MFTFPRSPRISGDCMSQGSKAIQSLVACLMVALFSTPMAIAETEEEAYSRVIAERSAKIVEPMKLSDAEQSQRVQKIIADQYRTLRDIHAERDAAQGDEAQIQVAKLAMLEAHNRFLAQLRAELTCEQVEQMKDGLTYGVVGHTYNGYLAQLPNLKDEEKRAIRAFLIEARELAMDGGSAEEKHGIFRKYKGKINNYLSAAGYKQ
jgi:hypothetical protein